MLQALRAAKMATSLQLARLVVVVVTSTVVGRGAAAPLQWEGIQPVGKSPAAHHSHATVIVPTEQSVLYMFGGCLQEPKSSQGRKVEKAPRRAGCAGACTHSIAHADKLRATGAGSSEQ